MMDHLENKVAFVVGGVLLFVLLGLHTLTLVFAKEKPSEKTQVNVRNSIKGLVQNKTLLKIIVVFVIWNIANYATSSFSGAYQVGALGFTTTLASVIAIMSSIARVIFSKPLGKFADKHSFCKMLYICFATDGDWFLSFALPVMGFLTLLLTAVITLLRYTKRGEYYIFGGASILFGLFMPLLEYLVQITFRHTDRIVWSLYPLTVLIMLGGFLIFLAICRPAREMMERKLFL